MVRPILFAVVALIVGCDEFEGGQGMRGPVVGQVTADCGSFSCESGDNGGLIVQDGEVAIGIINLGRNSAASDVA